MKASVFAAKGTLRQALFR